MQSENELNRVIEKVAQLIPDYDNNYDTEPVGGDNPYYKCSHCHKTEPSINGNIFGHTLQCSYTHKWLRDNITAEEYELFGDDIKKYFSSLTFSELEEVRQNAKK